WILSAKLLSAVGVSLIPFVGILTAGLYVLAPDVVGPHIGIVLLTFATNLSESLLVTGIVLLVTLFLKRGALALVLGIVTYFAHCHLSDDSKHHCCVYEQRCGTPGIITHFAKSS